MTISHVRKTSNDGGLIIPRNNPGNIASNMKPSANAHFIPLTIYGVGKKSDESRVPTLTPKSEESTNLWEKIQCVRKLGKVSINGTRLDIASVIAVGK